MRWLLLFIFLSSTCLANSKLSRASFQVHVRPQLVGIHQDFRQILNTFTDYPPEVLQLLTRMDRFREDVQSLRTACPLRAELGCVGALSALQLETRELEKLFIHYQGNVHFSSATGLASLSGLRIWMRLEQARAKLQRKLDVEILCLSAGRAGERASTAEIVRLIDEIESYADLLVVEFIPPKYQDEFRSAWMNFFRPLHRHAELGGNLQFLTTNLDQLNFYWNLLNMRMTKRLKKTPEGMSGPLNAIQNRWNQVIRINYAQ